MILVTQQFYDEMRVRLCITGVVSVIIAGILFYCRDQVCGCIDEAIEDTSGLVRSIRHSVIKMKMRDVLWVVYYLLLAIVLRVPLLLHQPMRHDEANTFSELASRPLYYALSIYSAPNNHLLHTLLVHLSYSLFGNYPWAIRLPAFVAGLLLIPVSYAAAHILYGYDAAPLVPVSRPVGSRPLHCPHHAVSVWMCCDLVTLFSGYRRGYAAP